MSIVTPVGVEDRRRWLTRRMVIGSATVLAMATVAAIIGLILFGPHSSTVLRLYFAVVGLFIATQAVRNFFTYAFGVEVRAPGRGRAPREGFPNWPSELFDLEARVSLAKVSAFDYNSRLRPVLRELAARRLAAHWNIDLATQPLAARAHVRDSLWAELGDAPESNRDQRLAPGPSMAKIRDLIAGVEAI